MFINLKKTKEELSENVIRVRKYKKIITNEEFNN